ncbi:Hypothetical predicted protein [Cloeon dipterum]|uniref:Uncharacterized protein n=1 Tax=Cloeon dipterum TaxID=197152 RepID=A0A8S1DXE0_9INSE|nr:Hypothetical predicted protein [Cloeon dipterum]
MCDICRERDIAMNLDFTRTFQGQILEIARRRPAVVRMLTTLQSEIRRGRDARRVLAHESPDASATNTTVVRAPRQRVQLYFNFLVRRTELGQPYLIFYLTILVAVI